MTNTKESITNNIKIPSKNLKILKKNFSHCFNKEGNFDFNKFKKELSKNEDLDFSNESYGMDWLGKSYARLLGSDEATTLLKENKDWNKKTENKNSENLLVKGDNLEVLKHLSNAYYEKIKMIYIDPPYNTGGDGFVYQDDRKFSVEELSKLAGIDKEKAKRILEFTQSKSNSHSAWLTFMYPRLYIAKQLLKDDGVIFVSIDDNEVAQLRILMDEIFGEENFVGEFIRRTINSGKQDSTTISLYHENLLVFSKNKENINLNRRIKSEEERKKLYPLKDKYVKTRGRHYISQLDKGSIQYSDSLNYSIKAPDGTEIWAGDGFNDKNRVFRWSKEKVKWGIKKEYIVFKKQKDGWKVYAKSYEFRDNNDNEIIPSNPYTSLDYVKKEYSNFKATPELQRLFDGRNLFSFPKPTIFIKDLLKFSTSKKENDIILDFFAGSGTTGDAVMQLNAEDDGNRKYILVQLPEEIDKKKNKTAYDFVKNELKIENPTIFDITKERLIRAGKKIQEDNKKSKEPKDLSKIDFGFKEFETAPIWEDYNLEAESFDPQTKLFDESKLSKEDLKTLITTWKTYDGFSLTQNLKEIYLDGYKGHYFDNKLYLVDKGFETKHLKKLLEEIDENKDFNPATIIVFGYNFQSKMLREIADNVKSYANKKHIDIDFITRY